MRLVLWGTAYGVGVAFAIFYSEASPRWLSLPGLMVLGLGYFRAWNLTLAVCAFTFGGIWGVRAVQTVRAPSQVPENIPLAMLAQVVAGPEEVPNKGTLGRLEGENKTRLRLRTVMLGGKPITGEVMLYVFRGRPALAPGDGVALTARLIAPWGFANPTLPDQQLAYAAKGIDWVATVRTADEVHKVREGAAYLPRRLAYRLRLALAGKIDAQLAQRPAAFVRTMVLGERTGVDEKIEEGFRAAGATHALSVSGLHLAVVVMLVFLIFRRGLAWVPGLCLRIPSEVLAAALAIPVVWLYAFVTGEAVATLRAAWMATVMLAGIVLARPSSLATSIAFAGLISLLENPLVLVDVSFQLSFLSVAALGLFANHGGGGEGPNGRWQRAQRWLLGSLATSLAATLVTAPVVAHHFGEFTPAAPVGNLLLVPLVELIVLPCGLFGALLGLIHPWAAYLPLLFAGWGARLSIGIAEFFRVVAPILQVYRPTVFEVLLLVASAGSILWGLRVRGRHRRQWMIAAGVLGLSMALSMGIRIGERRWARDLKVTFLDVGQGDAALVEGPKGFVALVDGGGQYNGAFDPGARIIEPVLRGRGISHVHLLVLSHPHPDHLNGLLRVVERFSVDEIWTNGEGAGNPRYDDFVALARTRGIPVRRPYRLEHQGIIFEPLGPWLGQGIAAPPGVGANDASLVLRVLFAGRSLLLPGDIESQGEFELVGHSGQGTVVKSDLLKVPHHGSRTSSSDDFLTVTSPQAAVVSAGRFNNFGFPHQEVLHRYGARGIRVFRTDWHGAITFSCRPDGLLHATCMRPCR